MNELQTAKPIESQFTKHGFAHTLLDRLGAWCLFSRGKPGKVMHFEVVRVKVSEKEFRDGGWCEGEPHEIYPSTSEWGHHGFTLTNETQARERLALLGEG